MCEVGAVTGKLASGYPNEMHCSQSPYWKVGPTLSDLLLIQEKLEIKTLLEINPVQIPEIIYNENKGTDYLEIN